MPLPDLVTTIGAANANSYVSLVEAATYFDVRFNGSLWLNLSSDDQKRTLLMATQRLNRINWLGVRVTDDQALAWPRLGVMKTDGMNVFTNWWPGHDADGYFQDDEIPQQVKDAQCEYALDLISSVDLSGNDISAFSTDGVSVTLRNAPQDYPSEVSRLIAGLTQGNVLVRA